MNQRLFFFSFVIFVALASSGFGDFSKIIDERISNPNDPFDLRIFMPNAPEKRIDTRERRNVEIIQALRGQQFPEEYLVVANIRDMDTFKIGLIPRDAVDQIIFYYWYFGPFAHNGLRITFKKDKPMFLYPQIGFDGTLDNTQAEPVYGLVFSGEAVGPFGVVLSSKWVGISEKLVLAARVKTERQNYLERVMEEKLKVFQHRIRLPGNIQKQTATKQRLLMNLLQDSHEHREALPFYNFYFQSCATWAWSHLDRAIEYNNSMEYLSYFLANRVPMLPRIYLTIRGLWAPNGASIMDRFDREFSELSRDFQMNQLLQRRLLRMKKDKEIIEQMKSVSCPEQLSQSPDELITPGTGPFFF